MSSAKHTPGPWRAGMSSVLARNPKTGAWATIGGYRKGIAFSQKTGRANLTLAAAAPELLDALIKVKEELRACQAVIHLAGGFDPAYVIDAQIAMKQADASIAKATGAA